MIAIVLSNLLNCSYRDKFNEASFIKLENILVVAPYNMQVNLLKQVLPPGTRVGTVDNFQGQEAEVVIISMTTSNSACLPRRKDFLFSRNRLNVAISRAKTWAILVASPDLLKVQCTSVKEMALVNTLCRIYETYRTDI